MHHPFKNCIVTFKAGGLLGYNPTDRSCLSIQPISQMPAFRPIFLLSFAALPASAAIVSEFSGGNGNGVDSFPGSAGAGWQGGWSTVTDKTTASATVLTGSPVNGGGNYLSASSVPLGTGTAVAAWGRQYGGAGGGLSLSQSQTISWSFRIDESQDSLANNFTTGNDRYQFFGTTAPANSSGAANEWFVFASGDNPAAVPGFVANHWGFYNGGSSSTAFNSGSFIDSGITAVSGQTYSFTIVTDPLSKTYVGSISINGSVAFTSAPLNWRSYSTNPTSSGGYFFAGVSADAAGESRSFSLDGINIVPEPSALLLASTGLLSLAVLRRR